MIRFDCDYTEGAHPLILQALQRTNMEQCPGYGEDAHCDAARAYIRAACAAPEADVHFLVGGTQANFTVIASILRPYQGVLCADTGHIACHETGAVEATGHKVLPLPNTCGKITAEQVRAAYHSHWSDVTHEHLVQPGNRQIADFLRRCKALYVSPNSDLPLLQAVIQRVTGKCTLGDYRHHRHIQFL